MSQNAIVVVPSPTDITRSRADLSPPTPVQITESGANKYNVDLSHYVLG